MLEMQKVNSENLSDGAISERLDLEFKNVLDNILDPNTTATVIREINLKIKIKPSPDRATSNLEIQASSKLAPVTEHVTQIHIGRDVDGKPEASEVRQPKQLDLFNEKDNEKIIKMEGNKSC